MEEKKIRVRLFFMYMPYIKFQESSIWFVHKVVPIQNAYVQKRGITQSKIYGIGSKVNKASQAIQSPRTIPLFLLVSLLDGYSFPNVLVKGIVAFKH